MHKSNKKLLNITKDILFCRNMIFYAECPFIKSYYQAILTLKLNELAFLRYKLFHNNRFPINNNNIKNPPLSQNYISMEFTPASLSKFNGINGSPAYIAVNGIVYDMSNEAAWGGGTHFGLYAGKDLSEQFNSCHNNKVILDELPKVGILKS